jgi:RND family efflux transporter MFP subunit
MKMAKYLPGLAGLPLLIGLSASAEEPVPVTVQPVAELLFHPERSAPAEVVPLNDARLSAEINARVLALPVKVGQQVAAGETLARLDCRDYESRLDAQHYTRKALSSRLELARTQLKRARDLRQARNISDEEVDRRETELAALQSELAAQMEAEAQAKLNLGRCEVIAPFDAVVAERLASVGDLAAPGTPLLRLVQTADAEVSARVRPAEAQAGAEAQDIEFSWLGRRYPLKLLRASPVVEPSTRTREVRLGFVGEAAPPGASGRLHWRSALAHLPADLLVRRDGRLGVFLANDDHARFVILDGAVEGQPAAAELDDAQRIVVEGRHGLQDGMTVRTDVSK